MDENQRRRVLRAWDVDLRGLQILNKSEAECSAVSSIAESSSPLLLHERSAVGGSARSLAFSPSLNCSGRHESPRYATSSIYRRRKASSTEACRRERRKQLVYRSSFQRPRLRTNVVHHSVSQKVDILLPHSINAGALYVFNMLGTSSSLGFLLRNLRVIGHESSLHERIPSNSVDDAEPFRSELMSSVPSCDHNHDVPDFHQLHQMQHPSARSYLSIIIAILICNIILVLNPPCRDVVCSGTDFLVAIEKMVEVLFCLVG